MVIIPVNMMLIPKFYRVPVTYSFFRTRASTVVHLALMGFQRDYFDSLCIRMLWIYSDLDTLKDIRITLYRLQVQEFTVTDI